MCSLLTAYGLRVEACEPKLAGCGVRSVQAADALVVAAVYGVQLVGCGAQAADALDRWISREVPVWYEEIRLTCAVRSAQCEALSSEVNARG